MALCFCQTTKTLRWEAALLATCPPHLCPPPLQAKQSDGEQRQMHLSAKLERMSLEKQALQNRNAVLEKVLALREQELSRARLGGPPAGSSEVRPWNSIAISERPQGLGPGGGGDMTGTLS